MEIVFPTAQDVEDSIATLLRYIGENPGRDGLQATPHRVRRMWEEITKGYKQDPAEILSTTFDQPYDEMVVLKDIRFHSMCEHHLALFGGTVAIGYLPGRVVGISKLARLVECFARRLQIQERMTQEIAGAIEKHLEARGVGVVVKAHHSCMGCRGVLQPNAEMVTSAMLGFFREKVELRSEFLAVI